MNRSSVLGTIQASNIYPVSAAFLKTNASLKFERREREREILNMNKWRKGKWGCGVRRRKEKAKRRERIAGVRVRMIWRNKCERKEMRKKRWGEEKRKGVEKKGRNKRIGKGELKNRREEKENLGKRKNTHSQYIYISFIPILCCQSAGVVEYTDCTSAEGYDPPNECPVMTLNDLMVKLQWC